MNKIINKTISIITIGMATATILLAANAKVGKPAPEFNLQNINGESVSLSDYKGKFIVLEWTNYGCPFVKKHYNDGHMQGLQKQFTDKDVIWFSICSSAKGKQGHMGTEEWKKATEEKGVAATQVLLDPDGKVGKTYGAKTTPHMFIINPEGKLIYNGAIDNMDDFDEDLASLDNYVVQALNEAMDGKSVSTPETKPYGCSVKY